MKLETGHIVYRRYKSGKNAYYTVIRTTELYAFLSKNYHKKPVKIRRELRTDNDGALYSRSQKKQTFYHRITPCTNANTRI